MQVSVDTLLRSFTELEPSCSHNDSIRATQRKIKHLLGNLPGTWEGGKLAHDHAQQVVFQRAGDADDPEFSFPDFPRFGIVDQAYAVDLRGL